MTSTSRKLALLGSLYFSQGLPFGFFTQALPPLLRKQGYSLGEIGLTSLLAAPWALKFLWAPAVDRFPAPGAARRKAWIIPLQSLAVALLVALAASGVGTGAGTLLMMAVLLLNLVAATQDIATDGLAVDLLAPSERGFANGLQVAGYRVGMIVGGGILLIIHDRLGGARTLGCMAVLTALATLPVAAFREPHTLPSRPGLAPTIHFLRRPGAKRVLLLIVVYKAGDAFATGMLRPFLADRGLSLADIGWLLGTVGFSAGLVGALAGGLLVNRLGRRPALVIFGLCQAASVAGYATLALAAFLRPAPLYAICAAEHFAGGMATAALFTAMMDWCSEEASATDYTVQASAVVVATGVASALAGFSAQAIGYFGHFCLASIMALGAVAVVRGWFPTPGQAALVRRARKELVACA